MKAKNIITFLFTPVFVISLLGFAPAATQAAWASTGQGRTFCDDNAPLCTEPMNPTNYEGNYIGHDEPSLLFYSNKPGSGNSSLYRLTLPRTRRPCPSRTARAARSTSSSIRRSGSVWRCATSQSYPGVHQYLQPGHRHQHFR